MSKLRTYTNDDVIEAVKTSTSRRQVLAKLGLAEAGGNYAALKNTITKLHLDTSHFTGMLWSKGKTLPSKRALEVYLSNTHSIQSHKLRLRLIKEGIFEAKCYKCDNTKWLGQPIALELEHINGNHLDNTLTNLTILCPNCHAQTETYRGRSILPSKKPKCIKPKPALKVVYCVDCNKKIDNKATRCKSCAGKTQDTKINWPTIEQLETMLAESNYTKVGQLLGVSDNAVRQHIKRHK